MVDFEKSRLKALQKIQSVALFDAITEQSAINNSPARRMERAKYWQKLDEIEKYEAMQETTTAGAIAKEQKLDQLRRELAAIEAMGDAPAPAVAQHNKAQQPRQKTHYVLLNERLVPRTTWRGGRIRATDILTLEEAARFASTHASTDITPNDFLRAAANGEILLRAIVQGAAKVQSFNGAIFCNAGQVDENIVPAGSIPTLPLTACQHLAAAGRASWRTFDGFESIEGILMRFTNGALIDGEPNFETVPADCRVMGNDVYALADAFIEVPAHSTVTPVPVVGMPSNVVHSTRARRNTLTPVIELAQAKCSNKRDAAEVWAALLVLAEKKHPPLIGVTEDGLQYLKDGEAAIFKRKSLQQRLTR